MATTMNNTVTCGSAEFCDSFSRDVFRHLNLMSVCIKVTSAHPQTRDDTGFRAVCAPSGSYKISVGKTGGCRLD